MTAPDGQVWELYAYRAVLPRRPRRRGRRGPGVGRLLVRLLRDLPRAAIAARGSDDWTIEAVTWYPRRTAHAWSTTREFRGHVLAQVEGQLARGERPTPGHAVYLGASD